ncbi:acyltransferase family protein [Enterobacter cloacae]|uniref:acyltransferase family protein n=1 Tax=Enterobacter cloacae TaxID=550 RepID=UPI0022809022|nr:acyltransferase [Enterobacter cloacae]
MRGMASLAVAVAHFVQFYVTRFIPESYVYAVFFAQSSVMVFFSMSGFLIGKSIQRNKKINGAFSLSSYAESRAKRIYPPLVLSILLILVLHYLAPYIFESGNFILGSVSEGLKNRGYIFYPSQLLATLTFLNGILPPTTPFNTPLWSLPFEVWCYITVGLACTRKLILTLISIIIFLCIASMKFEFFMYSLVWFSGFAISYFRPLNRYRMTTLVVSLSLCLVASMLAWILYIKGASGIVYYNATFGIAFTAFIYFAIVNCDIKISFLKESSKYSYTLYITHYPILILGMGIFESAITSNFQYSFLVGMAFLMTSIIFAKYASKIVESKVYINKLM